ncbi:glycosyltransferase family 4 protein [Stappia sp.]|uniref:glycosyltransferase family 4 protein n=1 Tax=Stappia sp. TaxID=1870903 RepID=UPI003A98D305
MTRPGGVQSHVRDLSCWLRNEGHAVRVVAPYPPAGVAGGGVTCCGRARMVSMFGTRFEVSLAGRHELRRLAADLHDWGAEVVHLHTPWTPLMAWQLWQRLHLPTVTTFHATLPEASDSGVSGRVLHSIAGYFMKRSRAVVVPSEAPLAHLRPQERGISAHVLPPAVNLAPWREAGFRRAENPAGGLEVGFLGRFEARKGLDVLLEAWPGISVQVPDARLTIAGAGPLLPSVREAMAGVHGDRIRLVETPDDATARALVAAWDIVVAPAPYGESFGLVLVEAMAAGALPVAAANAGYASVLGQGEGVGLLVPPGDAGALIRRIAELAERPDERDALRRWSVSRAGELDLPEVGPRLAEIYREALVPSA